VFEVFPTRQNMQTGNYFDQQGNCFQFFSDRPNGDGGQTDQHRALRGRRRISELAARVHALSASSAAAPPFPPNWRFFSQGLTRANPYIARTATRESYLGQAN
jgi:hypothetical protein